MKRQQTAHLDGDGGAEESSRRGSSELHIHGKDGRIRALGSGRGAKSARPAPQREMDMHVERHLKVKGQSAEDGWLDRAHLGDCAQVLESFPQDSVNLIFTSPPYAEARKKNYGGIHPDEYVAWFLERSSQMQRVLHPRGSFVLNIKESVVNGERHTYVLELILELRKQGWRWTDEYMWHKKNSYPGKWPNRFRDGWERLLHFTLAKDFDMYQEEVMVPVKGWAKNRLGNLSKTDALRDPSKNDNGFGKQVANWVGRDLVYPNNVLHLATECGYKKHPAAFPEQLPEWFIKLFSKPGDVVLDPFSGSGTTLAVAQKLGRRYVGVEISEEYLAISEERCGR